MVLSILRRLFCCPSRHPTSVCFKTSTAPIRSRKDRDAYNFFVLLNRVDLRFKVLRDEMYNPRLLTSRSLVFCSFQVLIRSFFSTVIGCLIWVKLVHLAVRTLPRIAASFAALSNLSPLHYGREPILQKCHAPVRLAFELFGKFTTVIIS